ncbi:SufB/SufD family protein [Yoonia sediminilitoris]|uniref:Fe-S cluster assembly protein SufD n=1 Tax=Yoonia sediminilitoris TaxID=1286148 RepID=A0A2T6KCT5_9RHOB|nr:SufD family Fe-S cluster assembly protein [Yoonia sediminilitoris]PUB12779.1 Fe-S cluster assembly protein SufD [Yoonia sediminilitoris]RCW94258.1 Fe-S cluster assembly protein SufD [Yoonia sediminilitoris]
MALAKLKADTTEARLEGVTLPGAAAWSNAARADALARVRQMGLPTRRDEYWKYTDPTSLTVPTAPEAALFDNDEGPLFDAVDRIRIVFVDGVFDPDASDDLSGEGLEISRLADAMATDIHWAKDLYGVLEARGQNPVDRALAALNTATATDGVVIRVTGKASKPVNLIYLHRDVASDAVLHNVIKVEAGAEMTLLETGPAAARFSKLLEVDVADGGRFHHVRAQGRDHERRAVTHGFARIGEESTFKSFTLTFNGVLTRNECVLEIVGDNATAHVAGVCVGDGTDFHHDDTVFITHDAVNCESRQVFKKVLRNGATGVFQGKILVKEGAQKTDGYQISQSLLLDDDSQFLAKPELEIYADDVACSHGSTSGAIDEDALFYLRSRGVPEKAATSLLTLAFLAEALEEIEDEGLAEELRDRLESWLQRHSS